MKGIKKRIYASIMAMIMVFSMIPTVSANAEDDAISISITLPEGSEEIVLTDEEPSMSLNGVELTLSGIEGEICYIEAWYEANDVYKVIGFYPSEESGKILGDTVITSDINSGTYSLCELDIYFVDEELDPLYLTDNLPESSFTVENNITDTVAPVISNVQFKDSGKTFTQGSGETLEITAEFSDEGLGLNEDGLYVDLLSVNDDWFSTHFVKQADGTYKATIYIDGNEEKDEEPLSNTEWYIGGIGVEDQVSNSTWYDATEGGNYWYFRVEDEDGNCEGATSTITVNFQDDYGEVSVTETVYDVDRGTVVLAQLLDKIPEYNTDLGFLGWKCAETGQMLEKDTVFSVRYDWQEFNFYPVTEKKEVEVDTRMLDADGNLGWSGYQTYLVSKEATYADLIQLIPTPETVKGCKFVEWDLGEYKLTDVIEDDYVDLVAVYDKMPVEVNMNQFDEEGDWVYESKTYALEEGSTYKDLFQLIDDAEDILGCTFTGWKFYDSDISLEDKIEYSYVDIYATYDKYPVQIRRMYIDETGSVKCEDIMKLYPAGTTMESIYKEWAVTPGDASSDPIEWVSFNDDVVSVNNYTLTLCAQYEDKMIVEYNLSYVEDAENCGIMNYETIYKAVEKDECTEDYLIQYFYDEILEDYKDIQHYQKLEYTEWIYDGPWDWSEELGYWGVSFTPDYESTTPLVYLYEEDTCKVYALNAGETLSLPTELNGYYVTWEDWNGVEYKGSYTVPKDAQANDVFYLFFIRGEKVTSNNQVDDPDDEDKTPNNGDNTSNNGNNTSNNGNNTSNNGTTTQGTTTSTGTSGSVSSPNTADGSNAMLFYGMIFMLGAGALLVTSKKRRNM